MGRSIAKHTEECKETIRLDSDKHHEEGEWEWQVTLESCSGRPH